MAIVKGPAYSVDASGNVGGMCFTKWRGLQIAKSVWSGGKPPTTPQIDQKDRMVTAQRAWGGVLTGSERESWRAAAADQVRMSRLKTPYIPSGYHYFIGLTVQLLRQGIEIRRLPPIRGEVFMFTSITAIQVTGVNALRTRFLGRIPDRPDYIQGEDWMAGPYVSGGYHAQARDYRFQKFRSLTAGSLYSDLDINKYYWFKMRWIDEFGRVGNWFEIVTLVTG